MAKRKKYRLKQSDVVKNSGKEISHTISKIKAHERFYTTILVIIFMIVISTSIFFLFRITPNNINYNSNYTTETGFSYTSNLIFLSNKNTGNDNRNTYVINISNMTEYNENYAVKLVLNDEFIKKCNCNDRLLPISKLRYNIGDGVVRSVDQSNMILTTGFIGTKKVDTLKFSMWIEGMSQSDEYYFYGKLEIVPIDEL